MKRLFSLVAALGLCLSALPATAQDDPVRDAVLDYMDFATYHQGIIQPQQLDETVFKVATFVDARTPEEFEAGHIPGAVNIDWRAFPGQVADVPGDMIVVYCNSGTLSAQAAFAARLMGHEHVVMLQGGLEGWQRDGVYKPQ
jgi:rhodanese-related sulfurtransferase